MPELASGRGTTELNKDYIHSTAFNQINQPFANTTTPVSDTISLLPLPENNKLFSAKNKLFSAERKQEFENAKVYLDALVSNLTLPAHVASQLYYSTYPTVTPYPLRESNFVQSYKAWRNFNRDKKCMVRFFGSVDRPCRFILTAKDLGLDAELADPRNFFEKLGAWKDAINQMFNTKNRNNIIWYKIECADRIHAHVFASHDATLNHLPRGTTPQHKVRLIEDPEDALAYLKKPGLTDTPDHLAIWIQARRDYPKPKQLPRVSGFRNLPNSRTWNKA